MKEQRPGERIRVVLHDIDVLVIQTYRLLKKTRMELPT